VLRDLKRIHSHICSVAYPVLEAMGELQPSRLTAQQTAPRGALQGASPRSWPQLEQPPWIRPSSGCMPLY